MLIRHFYYDIETFHYFSIFFTSIILLGRMEIHTFINKASCSNKRSMRYDTKHFWTKWVLISVNQTKFQRKKSRKLKRGNRVGRNLIAQDITFITQKLKFDGHVNYGDLVVTNKHDGQLENYALVLVLRPFKAQ